MLPLMEELNPLKMTNGALGNVARADIWPMANMGSNRSLDESDASMRQRLVNSLSQSFPGSALSRALNYMDSDSEDMKTDPLSSSCFTELRLDKGPMDEDDELTSLAWLQDTNLIKNINAGEVDDQLTDEDGQKENGDIQAVVPASTPIHPPHVPYNPQKHINNKPPYSFSCLIFMAIEESPQKSLPVKDIYSWILKNFPYFLSAPTGWKNSVRHNLSLNKCFKKVEKEKGQSIGKGSLWCIDPDYRPNLLQALRKTPYHPYHQLQMLAGNQTAQANSNSNQYNVKPVPLAPKFSPNSLSLSHLFPFLSKRLAQSGCDTDSDIHDVAYTLMSMKGLNKQNSRRSGDVENSGENNTRLKLKRKQRGASYGPVRKKQAGPIVCTTSPSEDHNYSATSTQATDDDSYDVSSSSIDDEYDFGPEADEGEEDEEEEGEEAYSDFDSYHSDFDEEESFSEEDTGNRPHHTDGSQQAVSTNASAVVGMTTASPSIDSATKTVAKEGFSYLPQSGKHANEARDKFINRQHRARKRLPILDEDEKKKIAEGADALLNLAGIKTTQITKTSTTAAVAVAATTAATNTTLTPTPAIEAPTFATTGSQDSTLLNGSETWTGVCSSVFQPSANQHNVSVSRLSTTNQRNVLVSESSSTTTTTNNQQTISVSRSSAHQQCVSAAESSANQQSVVVSEPSATSHAYVSTSEPSTNEGCVSASGFSVNLERTSAPGLSVNQGSTSASGLSVNQESTVASGLSVNQQSVSVSEPSAINQQSVS